MSTVTFIQKFSRMRTKELTVAGKLFLFGLMNVENGIILELRKIIHFSYSDWVPHQKQHGKRRFHYMEIRKTIKMKMKDSWLFASEETLE